MLAAKPYLQSISVLKEKVEDFETYPICLPIIRKLESISFHPDVTFFVGDNGSGKSTLMEAIAILLKLNPEGGSRNLNFSTADSHSDLYKYLRPSKGFKLPKDKYSVVEGSSVTEFPESSSPISCHRTTGSSSSAEELIESLPSPSNVNRVVQSYSSGWPAVSSQGVRTFKYQPV